MTHKTPILPPFTEDTARRKVQAAAEAWSTRDPEVVAPAYSIDCEWRDRDEFLTGRDAIRAFLYRKWLQQLHFRLTHELWSYAGHRISVRFESEWQHARTGQWYRTHGNEHWEFNDDGLMQRRDASANDIPIQAIERLIGVEATP